MLAIPLWGLYEVCIIIARMFGKKVTADEKA
jgi:Sec-independent protein secretion pathway component TatC